MEGNVLSAKCGVARAADRIGRGLARGSGVKPVDLHCVRELRLGRPSRRTAVVGTWFGIPLFGGKTTVVEPVQVQLGPGRIVLLVGPSGSGKSSALAEIERRFAGGCTVQRVGFPSDAAIIDRIAPWGSLSEALSILTSCGMGDAHLWVRPFAVLSDGEKFRARLARAIALHTRAGAAAPLLCDEFCSMLHRRAAKAIGYGLRKIVTRRGLSVVVACSSDDIIGDLQPDTIVRLYGSGRCAVEQRDVRPGKPLSMRRRMRIHPGTKRDYNAFASMHYRASDELGFVDKVFVMREGDDGQPVGIVVYSHPPLELSLRNRATGGRFSQNPKRLNRSLRILRRLVIHPDLRGCGLGHHLVKKTLPQVGTEFVECLAAMGEFNPVFEKAGMTRIGQCDIPEKRRAALASLQELDVDPNSREFAVQVCRRRRVREIVARVVRDWYAATTGGGESRVERQSPQLLAQTFRGLIGTRPVYYLWRRGKAV